MAYTKIHAIKATVDKAIDYICNPEKTDEKMLVSARRLIDTSDEKFQNSP